MPQKNRRKHPAIQNYTDLQSFLNAHVSDMKKRNPRWSIGSWQTTLGNISRTTLVKILNGQRVPGAKLAQALIKYFDFDGEELDHFRALIQLKKNLGGRRVQEAILDQVHQAQMKSGEVPKQGFDKSTQALLEKWYHLPLLAMIHSKHFSQDSELLAKRFIEPVTKAQVDKALKLFLEAGLCKKEKDGRLSIVKNWQMFRPVRLKAQNSEIEKMRIALFQQMLALSQSRLPDFSRDALNEETELRAACVTISRSKIAYAKELIRQFTDKFSELVTEENGEDVFQLQIQFLSMTKNLSK